MIRLANNLGKKEQGQQQGGKKNNIKKIQWIFSYYWNFMLFGANIFELPSVYD